MKKAVSLILTCAIITGMICGTMLFSAAAKSADKTEIESFLNLLSRYPAGEDYPDAIASAGRILDDGAATSEEVDACVRELMMIYHDYAVTPVQFDTSNIVLSFGAVSDVHLDPNDTFSVTKYKNMLQVLMDKTNGKLDAMTIAGDMSQNYYMDSIPQKIIELNNEYLNEDTKFFFVTGNHDASSDTGYSADLTSMFEQMADCISFDLPSSDHSRGNRHAIINGYHFIGLNMLDYWNPNEAMFMDEDLEWLARELAAARADAPGKQIFLYTHAAVYGTTYGSTEYTGSYWGSKKIYQYLEDYPEVVSFSGHVHWPVHDNRSIYQKDFTSLNCGDIYYMALGGAKTGLSSEQTKQIVNGYLVQVDINSNIKVTRLDFMTGKTIKEPFYIPAPDMEYKTHLLYYNPEYLKLYNKAPKFAADAQVNAVLNGSDLEVTFPAASDDDMVNNYVIEVKSIPSGRRSVERWFSDFYLYSKPSEYPSSYTRTVSANLGNDVDYEVSVYAEDSLECLSEPIAYNTLTTPDKIENSTGGDFVNLDFITGEPRNAVSNNTQTIRVTNGEISRCFGKYCYKNSADSHLNISASTSIYTLTSRKFTSEVTFVPCAMGNCQYVFGCTKDNKGYAFIINADGTLSFSINNASSGNSVVTSLTVLEEGKMYTASAVFSSNTVEMYLNGIKEGQVTVKGNASFNNNTPFVVGAKLGSGNVYSDFFDGYVYQAGVYSSSLTSSQLSERYGKIAGSFRYKIMQPLYDELGYIESVKELNTDKGMAETVCDNYISELNAALNCVCIDGDYINKVLHRDKYLRNLSVLSCTTDIGEYETPVIAGIEDGGSYDITNEVLQISWDDSTASEMNHISINSGCEIDAAGEYQIIVRNHDKSAVAEFGVVKNEPANVPGDFDGDGAITVADALAALRIAAKLVSEDSFAIAIGDIDKDGHVTVADALAILRVAAKLADHL